jgi:hypothetical protein
LEAAKEKEALEVAQEKKAVQEMEIDLEIVEMEVVLELEEMLPLMMIFLYYILEHLYDLDKLNLLKLNHCYDLNNETRLLISPKRHLS